MPLTLSITLFLLFSTLSPALADPTLQDRQLPPGLKGTPATIQRTLILHGVFMCIPMILLFPMGAMILRSGLHGPLVRWHYGIQLFGVVCLIIGLSQGLYVRYMLSAFIGLNEPHVILGLIVVVILILVQPVLGFLHHRHFRQKGTKNMLSPLHVWTGRIALLLGAINGGNGLKLARDTEDGGAVAYAAVVVLVFVAYVGVLGRRWWMERKRLADENDGSAVELRERGTKEERGDGVPA